MTGVLVRKLLRDVRVGLIVVALLLFAFQILWCRVSERIIVQVIQAFQTRLGAMVAFVPLAREIIFQGPGKIMETLMGGENIQIDRAFDMVSIAYVHPLTQTILCVWAVGRASGAIAGEIDKGTMELLLAQPIRRGQVILAHLCVDAITIPVLCLAMWAGTWVGVWSVGFLDTEQIANHVDPWRFAPGLMNVAVLVFAVSGATMLLSSLGRLRGRVLGLAVLVVLLQFLVNVIGQMWPPAEYLRPFTVFYYYQPQRLILDADWASHWAVWQRLIVLTGIGAAGYLAAWQIFRRRDVPAPL
jgi:ABC-2 type transport system permease protein